MSSLRGFTFQVKAESRKAVFQKAADKKAVLINKGVKPEHIETSEVTNSRDWAVTFEMEYFLTVTYYSKNKKH